MDATWEFAATGTVEQWTAPADGNYRIEAVGASGATPTSGPTTPAGGARISGVFSLIAGETLNVLVGQAPTRRGTQSSGGGGGGTFVYRDATDDFPLVAAGGAGGTYVFPSGAHATVDPDGGAGVIGGSANSTAGAGGVSGGGGATVARSGGVGGGGAGWRSDGVSNTALSDYRGRAPRNGGAGADLSGYASADGGFGGGGGGIYSGDYSGFGGGGGFSGGGGAVGSAAWSGGGGGSYNAGVEQDNEGGYNQDGHGWVVITQVNRPPHAPTLLAPVDTTIDRAQGQRFSWSFNDPDGGDSQSAYRVRARPQGASSWVEDTGWVTSTGPRHDFSAGTFGAGDFEWQAATKDAQGEAGPFSSSGFFTVGDAPPGPSVTDPVNGATIPTDTYDVVWSTPDQDAFQIQVLADAGVLVDSGTVTDSGARSWRVEFPENQVTRTLRVRVLFEGLWSPWSSVTVDVSYDPPATPEVGVSVGPSTITVNPTFPEPGDTQPDVESWDLWVRGGPEGETRLARGRIPNQPYQWWLPASGVDYAFRVRANGNNGTHSWSEWTGASEPIESDYYYGGSYA